MKARFLRGLDPADIEEFGVDEGDANNLPRLIAALPESEREAYRERMRSHVREMTGGVRLTWKQYMNRSEP